jgi:hypothetical protein
MTRDTPAWLGEFQACFGEAIRAPLDRTTGTLTATPSSYDPRIVADMLDGPTAKGTDRLAVYNRQYWFRLFDVVQSAFPLTARLVGYWSFNDYAARFLLARPPPRGWDIDGATEGFEAFFTDALDRDDASDRRQALVESARIDAAWHDVFRAPKTPSFRPSAADATRLLDARLTPSPAVALIEEHYPLLELRKKVLHDPTATRVAVPPPLSGARSWMLLRKDEGIVQMSLEAREAELLALLRAFTVREALARLERACPPEERRLLPGKTREWLARSVERDLWIGDSGR